MLWQIEMKMKNNKSFCVKFSYYHFSHIFKKNILHGIRPICDAFKRNRRVKSNYKETVNLIFVWVLPTTMQTVNLRLDYPFHICVYMWYELNKVQPAKPYIKEETWFFLNILIRFSLFYHETEDQWRHHQHHHRHTI